MSAYIDAGYVVALGTLATYGATLFARERSVRRRVDSVATSADERRARSDSGELDGEGDRVLEAR